MSELPRKLLIIGGGVYAARLCEELATVASLPPLEIVIHARRPLRTAVIARHAARRVALSRSDWIVRSADELGTAAEGVDMVVLLARVGGLRARAWDETFPTFYGGTGDEGLGPGGMANAWRTGPVLRPIASTIRLVAPHARVLNLMAPLGITTRLLVELGLDATGLCELPMTSGRDFFAGPEGRSDYLHYAGINHLGWFWPADPIGERSLLRAIDLGHLDRRTFERFGAAPLRYYYELFDLPAAQRLGLTRPHGRAAALTRVADDLFAAMAATPGRDLPWDARPTPWHEHAIIPAVSVTLGVSRWKGTANLRNEGRLPYLPDAATIELRATWSGRAVAPIIPPPPPPPVAAFLEQVAAAEAQTYHAMLTRRPQELIKALRLLPLELPEQHTRDLVRCICGTARPPPTTAPAVRSPPPPL